MADFGWSASCILEAVRTSNKIRKAIQDSGGAKEHYAETVASFDQIDATFTHLQKHIENSPDAPSREAIVQQLKLMEAPWKRVVVTYLDKYEKSLGSASVRSKIKQMPRMVQWAVKDVDAVVRKEKVGVLEPLGIIRLFLSMDMMQNIKSLAEMCRKICEDMKHVGPASMLSDGFDRIEARAKTQETAHSEQSEKLLALQQTIGQHHEELVAMMNETIVACNPNSQTHRDLAESVVERLKKNTDTLEIIGDILGRSTVSTESIQGELAVQAARLVLIQKDVQQLVQAQRSTVTDTNWTSSADGWTVLTAISAFALGLLTRRRSPGHDHRKTNSSLTGRRPSSVENIHGHVSSMSSTQTSESSRNTPTLLLETAQGVDQTQWIADFNRHDRETSLATPKPRSPEISPGSRALTGSFSPEISSAPRTPYFQYKRRRSDKYSSAGGFWLCCSCGAGPHKGSHSFCGTCRHLCKECKISVNSPSDTYAREADDEKSRVKPKSGDTLPEPSFTQKMLRGSSRTGTESFSGSWECGECGAFNSGLTPDFCPVCGCTRSSL